MQYFTLYHQYKFNKNKGYGTKDHINALNKYVIIKRGELWG